MAVNENNNILMQVQIAYLKFSEEACRTPSIAGGLEGPDRLASCSFRKPG